MHEKQDSRQVLPGAPGSSEALTAPRVLSPKASPADSQISSSSTRKSRPVLEHLSRDEVLGYMYYSWGGGREGGKMFC